MVGSRNILAGMVVVAQALVFAACHNNAPIPLPDEKNGPAAPFTYPLQFDAPQPLVWEDAPPSYTPHTTSFDYAKLPLASIDSSGFRPFTTPPPQISFDWDNIPSSPFFFDSLPSVPLRFKTSMLPHPLVMNAGKFRPRGGEGDLLFDFAEPLDQGFASTVLKAADGRLWIYVYGKGLCCYDGQTVSIYRLEGIKNVALKLVEDQRGQIWLSTPNDGVFCLNFSNNTVRQITTTHGLPSNCSYSMMVDMQNRVWVACVPQNGQGLGAVAIIDAQKNELKVMRNFQGMVKNWSPAVMRDKDDNIWVLSDSANVDIIDLRNNTVKSLDQFIPTGSDMLSLLAQDRSGRVWVAGLHNLNVLDREGKTIYQIGRAQGFLPEYIMSLSEDQDGHMWAGSRGTVKVYHKDLLSVKKVAGKFSPRLPDFNGIARDGSSQMIFTSEDGAKLATPGGYNIRRIGNADISCLAEDADGRIWEAGLTNGIRVIDPATGIAKQFKTSEGLRSDSVQCLLLNDTLMVAANKTGLQVIDSRLKKMELIGPAQGLPTQFITSITNDKYHNIWVGGYNDEGITVIDTRRKTIRRLAGKQGVADLGVVEIQQDKKGLIWFWSRSDGLGIIDLQAKTIQHIAKQNPFLKSEQSVYKWIAFDSTGNTWLGTSEGLYMVNAAKDSVSLFTTNQGLLSNFIISLKQYKGRMYAGTKRGLNIITPPYLSPWGKWEIRSIGEMQGLTKTTNGVNSDLMTQDGQYWWGDVGSMVISNLDEKATDTTAAPVYINRLEILNKKIHFANSAWTGLASTDTIWDHDSKTGFYTKGQVIPADSILASHGLQWDSLGSFNMPSNLRLPHSKNSLQFHFAQVNMAGQDTVWYRYILQGIDKEWSERTTSNESENYLNLSPGKYTFMVTSLVAGNWQKPAEFSFTILTPWWKAWWAYLLYILLAIFAIWRFIHYRSLRLKKDNQLLEEMVKQRTNELSKSITELKATQSQLIQSEKMASLGELTAGIAHEIQNPLNFVNNFSDVSKELLQEMIQELDSGNIEEAKEIANDVVQNLEKINHHGKRADGIVKGMLQHSRRSTGVKENTDINKLADEYLRLAYHGLRAKDKSFNATLKTDFDESIGAINIVPQDIGRVILNMVTNAFYAVNEKKKQQDAGYVSTVLVQTKKVGDKVEISVGDNGNGIPANIVDKIFQPFFTTKPTGQGTGLGLSMSYDIVTKGHGGSLDLRTQPGEGTTFIISLPINS